MSTGRSPWTVHSAVVLYTRENYLVTKDDIYRPLCYRILLPNGWPTGAYPNRFDGFFAVIVD
jgi:hypothetical protein